ncbi:MAG: MFS transporter [Anaerolineaceae bacterium]|nr:MFS transporter [Anaerolineaceae bacterium]
MLKQFDRRMITILLIIFVNMVGASMVLPILPVYARKAFGVSDNVVTLLLTSFFLAQFIAGPYIGRLSDQYGRMPVLIISQIGTVISFIMIALGASIEILFIARILDGITGGNIIVAQAYITDITPPRQRTQALGNVLLAFGVGFILGPSSGGVLSSIFGPRIPFLFAALAATLTVILTWRVLDETVTPEMRQANRAKTAVRLGIGDVAHNKPLVFILVVTFGSQFAFSMLQATYALFGADVLFPNFEQNAILLRVGLLLSVVGMGQLFTQLFILKRALRRWQEYTLVIGGGVLRGLGLLTLALVPNPFVHIFGLASFAIGTGLQIPSLQGLAANSVPGQVRGAVMGVFQSAQNLGIIFGSAIAGTIYAAHTNYPLMIGGLLFFVMLLPSLMLSRNRVVLQET